MNPIDANDPGFTTAEREHPLFRKFMRLFEARVALHRERNDQDLDERQTARLRGELAEAKFYFSLQQDYTGLAQPTPEIGDGRRRK